MMVGDRREEDFLKSDEKDTWSNRIYIR